MNYSPTEKLNVEVIGNTALVTINNPGANTWDAESLTGLQTLLQNLSDDKNIYALVITGQGEKFFSAGADLKMFADGDRANAADIGQKFGDAFEALGAFRVVGLGRPWRVVWGAIGGGGTAAVGRGGLLTGWFMLPLYVPVLIFGAGCGVAAHDGLPITGQLYLLACMLVAAMFLAPWASAAALKIASESS